MHERKYTSKRSSILNALTDKFKEINGTGDFKSNIYDNAHSRMAFWDEINQYPAVHSGLGPESIVYQGSGVKERFLTITVRCFVEGEDPQDALELLLEDLETVIEKNGRLAYVDSSGATKRTVDILILSIDTDEGALAPIGVGELILQVRY